MAGGGGGGGGREAGEIGRKKFNLKADSDCWVPLLVRLPPSCLAPDCMGAGRGWGDGGGGGRCCRLKRFLLYFRKLIVIVPCRFLIVGADDVEAVVVVPEPLWCVVCVCVCVCVCLCVCECACVCV